MTQISEQKIEALAQKINAYLMTTVAPSVVAAQNPLHPYSLLRQALAMLLALSAAALVREQAAEQGWQPIETAPKDMTRILLSRAGIHAMHTAFYRDGVWHCGNHQYFNNPTHWMPLPAAPQQSKGDAG